VAYPDHIRRLNGIRVLIRKVKTDESKVVIITGGGSGHIYGGSIKLSDTGFIL